MSRKQPARPAKPSQANEYPKMVYGPYEGQKKIVASPEEEAETLEAFKADKPRPAQVDAPEDFDALKAGTHALAERLRIGLTEGDSAEDDLEMIALTLEERAKEAFAPEGGTQDAQEPIPSDWREQHHSTIIALADRLTDDEVTTKADAIAVIEAEIERRDNA